MNRDIFKFLKSYSCDITETNRLIVSSYLRSKKTTRTKNILINSLIIKKLDPDYEKLLEFEKKYSITTFEDLITAFEFVISPEEKTVTGAIYTPKNIRDFIVENLLKRKTAKIDLEICDIACGCGGFLYTSAIKLKKKFSLKYSEIFSRNLFGIDLMDYSVERSKILLSLLAISSGEDNETYDFNLFVGNSLEFNFKKNMGRLNGFDAIIGNPPYICSRNIDERSKPLLKNWTVSTTGHPDLYIPFFEIGINLLKNNGYLGYITMNSFFKSLNGRALRKYFSSLKYDFTILDYGDIQIFNSKDTYTCICLIECNPTNHVKYKKLSTKDKLSTKGLNSISYDNLDNFNGWNLQSPTILAKIEATGTPFHEIFKTGSGIATLKNNVFILDYTEKDDSYYYLESGDKIEKEACLDIVNPNKLISKSDLTPLRKKIIYPYIHTKKGTSIIPESKFMSLFPCAYSYLSKNKKLLATRDKGKSQYSEWFAYGREQGLEKYDYKLLFPHISPVIPNYVLTNDQDLLFHNGRALLSNDEELLLLAKKIMQSRLFWFYVVNSSKPYGSGYFSLSRNYIKSFGVYDFNKEQKNYILKEQNQEKVNLFLEELYEIDPKY